MPASQLLDIEEKSPHLKPYTNKIWMKVIKREFPKHVLETYLKNHDLYGLYIEDQNNESVESAYADPEENESDIENTSKQNTGIDYRDLYHELTHEMELKLQSASERLRKSMKKVQTERLTNTIVEIDMDPTMRKKRLDMGRKLMPNLNSPIGSSRSLEKSWKNTLTRAIQMSRSTNPSSGYAKISSKSNPYANQFRKTTNTIMNNKPIASINSGNSSRHALAPTFNASSQGSSFPRDTRVAKTEREAFKPTSSLKRKISQDDYNKSKGTAKKIFSLGSTPVPPKSSKPVLSSSSSSSFASSLASINSQKLNTESGSKLGLPKLQVSIGSMRDLQSAQTSPKPYETSSATSNPTILHNGKSHHHISPPSSSVSRSSPLLPTTSSLSKKSPPPLLQSSPSPPSSCHSSSSLSPPKTFQSYDSSPTKSSPDLIPLGTDSSRINSNSVVGAVSSSSSPTSPISPQPPRASLNNVTTESSSSTTSSSQNTSPNTSRPISTNNSNRPKPLRRPVSIFIRPKKRI